MNSLTLMCIYCALLVMRQVQGSPLTNTLNGGHRRRGSAATASQEHSQIPLMTHTHQMSEKQNKHLLSRMNGLTNKTLMSRSLMSCELRPFCPLVFFVEGLVCSHLQTVGSSNRIPAALWDHAPHLCTSAYPSHHIYTKRKGLADFF